MFTAMYSAAKVLIANLKGHQGHHWYCISLDYYTFRSCWKKTLQNLWHPKSVFSYFGSSRGSATLPAPAVVVAKFLPKRIPLDTHLTQVPSCSDWLNHENVKKLFFIQADRPHSEACVLVNIHDWSRTSSRQHFKLCPYFQGFLLRWSRIQIKLNVFY